MDFQKADLFTPPRRQGSTCPAPAASQGRLLLFKNPVSINLRPLNLPNSA
jgi:hypothetical protein